MNESQPPPGYGSPPPGYGSPPPPMPPPRGQGEFTMPHSGYAPSAPAPGYAGPGYAGHAGPGYGQSFGGQPGGWGPGYGARQVPGPGPVPQPVVVHVTSKPGGMAWAWGTMLGLVILGVVMLVGILVGLLFGIGAAAGAAGEEYVVHSSYRDSASGSSSKIAIIPIVDGIDAEQAAFVRAAVDDVLEDNDVRAVVLRVDSPGGEVAPSDQIWYQIKRLRDAGRPVVASYGGVAASGGYFVSCGADFIVAEETCITGSIGVIAQVLTLEGLMDKVGVKPVTLVATGSPQKNVANDMFRTWDERDKEKVKTMLDAAYATFNARVRDGRKQAISDPAAVDALADGSIYTAQQAKDNGLVDAIGYLDDAIAKAETLASLTPGRCQVVLVRRPPSLFGDGRFIQGAGLVAELNADAIRGLVNDLASPRIMYLMN